MGGAAPIYLMGAASVLRADWDVCRLYPHFKTHLLDPIVACRYLTEQGVLYGPRTLFPDVKLLTERAQAQWAPAQSGEVRIDLPQPAPRYAARNVRPDVDVVEVFIETVRCSIDGWALSGERDVFCEVSGGLDSALVGCLASKGRSNPRSYGIALPGNMGKAQQRRRAELCGRCGFSDTVVSIREQSPLGNRDSPYRGRLSYPGQEFYCEAFGALLGNVRKHGGDLILTGIGGDELFAPAWNDLSAEEQDRERSLARTESLVVDFVDQDLARQFSSAAREVDHAPNGYVDTSVLQANLAGAPLYLRTGCWSAHPLSTPNVRRFAEFLPIEWRTDRKIEREALRRFGFSRAITHPKSKESFEPVMRACLRRTARPWLMELFADSSLAKMGIVNREALVSAYDDFCRGGRNDDISFYSAASLELTARAITY
jgi:asparagine synthase (glutamine-hydrolysing)